MVFMVGILSALAIAIVMIRLGMSKFAGYPALCDISVTLGLAALLYGTWSGMVAAIVGGLAFSLLITIYRRIFGFERLTLKGWKKTEGKTHEQFRNLYENLRNRGQVDQQTFYK